LLPVHPTIKPLNDLFAEALAERTNHHHQSMVLLKAKLQKLRQGLPPAKLQLRAMRPWVARRLVASGAATGKTAATVCPTSM